MPPIRKENKMFALILALSFNPANHTTTWDLYRDASGQAVTFSTLDQCEEFKANHPEILVTTGALTAVCDEPKSN